MEHGDERESELLSAGVHAARAARGLLASAMEQIPEEQQSKVAGVVSYLFAVEVGRLRQVTEMLSVACADLQELTYLEGASAAFAHALTILYPISRELNRQSGPPVAISAADPILLQPSRKKITMSPDERRAVPRAELEVDIGVHSEANFYAGFSGDVSAGGIFVATYKPLPVGAKTTLSFVLPGGYHVVCEGEVTWLRDAMNEWDAPPGMGISFVNLSDEDGRMIRAFAEERAPMFHDLEP